MKQIIKKLKKIRPFERCAYCIAFQLSKNKSHEKRFEYHYLALLFLFTSFELFLIGLISYLLNCFILNSCVVLGFAIARQIANTYHADTFEECCIISTTIFTITALMCLKINNVAVCFMLGIFIALLPFEKLKIKR